MNLQVGVKILLKNKEGKFLLLKRSNEKYPDLKDNWDIVGGRIEPGLGLIENLEREIREETGLILKEKPRLIGAQDILKKDNYVVRLTYVGEIEGEPILSEEHIEYKWVTPGDLLLINGLDMYLLELLKTGVTHEI